MSLYNSFPKTVDEKEKEEQVDEAVVSLFDSQIEPSELPNKKIEKPDDGIRSILNPEEEDLEQMYERDNTLDDIDY